MIQVIALSPLNSVPPCPTGAGVGVTQVEFGEPAYLPQAGSGTFTGSGALLGGKTFTAKSGPSATSAHA